MISCEESHVCGHWACRQSWVGRKLCCFPPFSYFFLGLQIQMQQMFVLLYLYGLLYEQLLVTNIASIREYRRRRRNQCQHPYYWTLPNPNESWFEIHYYDPTIPDDFFRQQLRMRRTTFQMLLNVTAPRITRLDTRFRNCFPPEKVLALGLFRLAHGNSIYQHCSSDERRKINSD